MDEEPGYVKREEGQTPSDDQKDGENGKHDLHSFGHETTSVPARHEKKRGIGIWKLNNLTAFSVP